MDKGSWWGRLCWIKLVVLILVATGHTAGVMEMISRGDDLVQISSNLSIVLILWQAILVYIQMCANRKMIKNFIIKLGAMWLTDNQLRPDMIAVKHQYVTSFLRWMKVFHKALSTYFILYLSPRLIYTAVKYYILKEKVPFLTPFYIQMPFKFDDNFLLYCFVYLTDFLILHNIGMLVTFDLLLLNATMHHLRLLFVILQNDFKDVHKEDVQGSTNKLHNLIPRHQRLLQLVSELSNAFGAIFIIHLAFFSGSMCFFGFAARVHCSPESVKTLGAVTIILVSIYMCCYFGQNLTDASFDIAQAVYEGKWYLEAQEYKKCVIIIMLRSQKVEYIKSTSFTDISLQTFTKILNVTWSFLSLITKVYEA